MLVDGLRERISSNSCLFSGDVDVELVPLVRSSESCAVPLACGAALSKI